MVDAGAHVMPVLTEDATRFVGALTFSALASEPARTTLFDAADDPIPHTRLGQTADVVIVAPATARLIGKYAGGISDDLLSATLLATRAPVVVAPAMHTEMWEHPAVQENLATLARRGVHVVAPESGRLAGGDDGAGRLAAPESIMAAVEDVLAHQGDLAGARVLVTAGGTREAIDPVRFIGNRSSGKMGHAVARQAAARGAAVTLVTTTPADMPAGVDVVRVTTAQEMHDAVLGRYDATDAVVMAAAVADFRPKAAAAGQAQEGRRPARDRARADAGHPRRARRDQAGPGARRASRPRPTTSRRTPPRSWRARAPTCWSPTTSRSRMPASKSTRTGRSCLNPPARSRPRPCSPSSRWPI